MDTWNMDGNVTELFTSHVDEHLSIFQKNKK